MNPLLAWIGACVLGLALCWLGEKIERRFRRPS